MILSTTTAVYVINGKWKTNIFVFILWDCCGSQISDSSQGYQTIKKKGPVE